MATVRWTGLGILVLPILILSPIVGAYVTTSLLYDLAAQGGDGIDHAGVPLGGVAAGVVLGGLVTQGLGAVLNRRRLPDGRVVWTGRHEFGDYTVEQFGRGLTVLGVLAAPLASIGFVPGWAVWVLLIGWAAVVVAVLAARDRRRVRREASEVRYLR